MAGQLHVTAVVICLSLFYAGSMLNTILIAVLVLAYIPVAIYVRYETPRALLADPTSRRTLLLRRTLSVLCLLTILGITWAAWPLNFWLLTFFLLAALIHIFWIFFPSVWQQFFLGIRNQ